MKLYKSLFVALALVGGMMSSCSEDGVWDKASQANLGLTDGTSYSFNHTSINYTYYPVDVMNGMDINVTVTRGTTEGTVTLPIKATFSDDDLISGPESVTFEDGSNTASYPIHVKQEFEPGMAATADLVIDTLKVGIPPVAKPDKLQPGATAEDSAKFEADSINYYQVYLKKLAEFKLATTVTVQKDYNWESLGVGTWNDLYMFGSSAEVEILQAVENSKIFRVNLDMETILDRGGEEADGNQSTSVNITILDKGQDFRGVTVDDDDYVYWTPINTGWLNDGLDVIAYHPMDFSANWARYMNTSYVAKYQENKLPAIIYISGLMLLKGTSSGWAPCQSGAPIASIVFPGVKVYNYNAKIEYAGLFTNTANVVYALADYELTGADAKNASTYKVAVISQNDDAEAVADAIAAGDYPAADLDDVLKNDRIQIEIPEGLSGALQIILVIIDKDETGKVDEVKNVVAAKFEYYGGANPWKSLGTGIYYDDFVVPYATAYNYGAWPVEVEIEEHSEYPGLFRLKNAYSGVAAAFGETGGEKDILIHAENPNAVYFTTQPTGFDLGDGEYSIVSYGGDDIEYFTAQGYSESVIIGAFPGDFGTLENGIITLPVIPRTDSDGNPIFDSEGNPRVFQGYLYEGEQSYYACTNGGFKVIMPDAAPSAIAKAKRAMSAADFALRLNGGASSVRLNNKVTKKVHHRMHAMPIMK